MWEPRGSGWMRRCLRGHRDSQELTLADDIYAEVFVSVDFVLDE